MSRVTYKQLFFYVVISLGAATAIGTYALTKKAKSVSTPAPKTYSKFIPKPISTKVAPSPDEIAPNFIVPEPPNSGVEKPTTDIKSTEVIVLTESNTLVFRGVVNSEKVANLQIEAMKKSKALKSTDVIYLVLDTPGGSIGAGMEFIDTLHALPQKVKTLTVFAASMGFQMAQNLDERLITPSGTLMSHRAKAGMEGEIPGEFLVQLNHLLRLLDRMETNAAERMGLDLQSYRSLVRDEYWVDGYDAVAQRAADRVVLARCDGTFDGTEKQLLGSIMGFKIYGIMSRCPVVTGILGVEASGNSSANESDRQKAIEFGWSFRDKRQMTQKLAL